VASGTEEDELLVACIGILKNIWEAANDYTKAVPTLIRASNDQEANELAAVDIQRHPAALDRGHSSRGSDAPAD